jgi:AraC-like DNA-binding protein
MRVAFSTFADPGEFAAMLNPSRVELVPFGRGRFTAELATVEAFRIRLRRTNESLPRLAHVQHPPDRAYFGFLADEASAPVVIDGMSVSADAVFQFCPAASSNQHSRGPIRWATISIDRGGLDAMSPDIAEQVAKACGGSRVVIPGNSAMRSLRRSHAEAVALAIQPSATLAEPEAARAMESHVVEALADCLADSEQMTPTPVQVRHVTVMQRFRELLDANLDRTLYLPEVCAALGVSHRTLSYCCQELTGMPPKRYFYLRRMHLVRRALRQCDRHATTVTKIATRYGFWELGRFSVQYKAWFDETPSATLRMESASMEH